MLAPSGEMLMLLTLGRDPNAAAASNCLSACSAADAVAERTTSNNSVRTATSLSDGGFHCIPGATAGVRGPSSDPHRVSASLGADLDASIRRRNPSLSAGLAVAGTG